MNNVEQEIRNTKNRETTDNISDNGPRPAPRQPRINDQNNFAGANFKNINLRHPLPMANWIPKSFSIGFQTWIIALTGMICLGEESDLPR